MVFRLYVEKKNGFDHEAHGSLADIRSFLRIPELTGLRILNRYDVEGIEEELFEKSIPTVFSEPQADNVYAELPKAQIISLQQNTCPASTTSAQTPPHSASSWLTAANVR